MIEKYKVGLPEASLAVFVNEISLCGSEQRKVLRLQRIGARKITGAPREKCSSYPLRKVPRGRESLFNFGTEAVLPIVVE